MQHKNIKDSMFVFKKPKVSVCIVTYNQEKFIGQCLQSIVEQKTNFDFEIIVGDDASQDGTKQILRQFVERYPGIIRAVFHEKNKGPTNNYLSVHSLARGEYVAHLDGDDLALPGKLQAQAKLLDDRADIALSAHAVNVIDSDRFIGADSNLPELATMADLLLLGTYFVNSSIMYRRCNQFATKIGCDIVDFYSHIEHASKGLIHLNKNLLGSYRWHEAGISKSAAHRDRIEAAYGLAFDRALELGAEETVVIAGRLRQRKSFAIARLAAGDTDGFRSRIKLSRKDRRHASRVHRVLSSARYFTMGSIGAALVHWYINR